MRKGKTMKKKNIIILVILAFLLGSTNSQAQGIFIMEDEEFNDRIGGHGLALGDFDIPNTPYHNSSHDYTPIGGGIWLLGGFAGAYLLEKQRRKADKKDKKEE